MLAHDIMICQDLVRQYGRKNTSPCYIIKIDMKKKAYYSLDWGFLEDMLRALNFPERFLKLVMVCVSSPKFTLLVNGDCYGFFLFEAGSSSLPASFF